MAEAGSATGQFVADGAYELVPQAAGGGALRVAVRGRIEIGNAQQLLNDLSARLNGATQLALDLSGVDYFDSGGGAVLVALRQRLAQRGRRAAHHRLDTGDRRLPQSGRSGGAACAAAAADHRATSVSVSKLGEAAIEVWHDSRELVVFSGELILGLRDALLRPRRMRWRETWLYMERTGLDAVPIVALISFLMGLITAFQAAVQLTQFGADIYIANLVGLSIVRELGPLMTAIIAAGRSGAAFAAEIGT